jgi:sugar transferase (PEP-CTERM/EpsH1 system associated)
MERHTGQTRHAPPLQGAPLNAEPLSAGAMPDLLFLAPCLPCPVDRGHRVRWHHMLRFLGRDYRVHLGCFADVERERAHLGRVQALCYETCFVAPPRATRMGRLGALARGEPHALPRDLDGTLLRWVERLLKRHPVTAAVACSARMAGYLAAAGCTRVVDLVELESERRRRAAAALRWPLRALQARAAERWHEHERSVARHCEHVLFASGSQATLFGQLAPESAHKASAIANGVDTDYYSPHIVHRNPFGADTRALVLAGAMDDGANAGAALWFAREVFGALHTHDPALRLFVVGARPGPRVRALARLPGVAVTGAVPDLRPYLAHAALVLAPQQDLPGSGHKVLEAMAMQKTVVASMHALAALSARPGVELLAADGALETIGQVRAGLAPGRAAAIGKAARAHALGGYHWPARLAPLAALCGQGAAQQANRA